MARPLVILLALAGVAGGSARAVDLDGVRLPETVQAAGSTLRLNGAGSRVYPVLGIHIYVAGLYLTHPGASADEIIRSTDPRLLSVTFKRDVDVDNARKAWVEGLHNNCVDPCHIDPDDLREFLTHIPAMHAGENFTMLFTRDGASIAVNGHQIGVVNKPVFAQAMLATFLGPRPASSRLKEELLGVH